MNRNRVWIERLFFVGVGAVMALLLVIILMSTQISA